MTKYENQCFGCDLPCIYPCPKTHVEVHYCDECEKNEADYKVSGNEYCTSCLNKLMDEQLKGIFNYFLDLFAERPMATKAELLGVDLERM